MSSLRDLVADNLEELIVEAGFDDPWTDRARASTRNLYAQGGLYLASRLRLHAELAETQRQQTGVAANGRLAVIVTAGPPGAGKSTFVSSQPDLGGFLGVDADDFKDALLVRSADEGHLDDMLHRELPDGRPVALRELAGFVHAESTAVADVMRVQAMQDGLNIVVHGTLANLTYADELLREVDEAGYRSLVVLDVEVAREAAIERSLQRWWSVREHDTDAMGGRFQPRAAVRAYFPDDRERSICAENAERFAERADAFGWDVDFRTIDDLT